MKKFFSLILTVGLLVPTAVPETISASNVSSSENTTSASQKVQHKSFLTVKDVIDEKYQEYIEKYKGEFSTYEEVRASANFDDGGTVDVDELDNSKSKGHKGIKVASVDEYAALLFYLDDQKNKSNTSKIRKSSGIGAYATKEFEEIISDTYIS